ncbi:MAG: hypothetical protein ACYS9X_32620 [Planctomycetota bacterium]
MAADESIYSRPSPALPPRTVAAVAAAAAFALACARGSFAGDAQPADPGGAGAPDEKTPAADGPGRLREELERVRAELDGLLRRHEELDRRTKRLRAPLEGAVEDYLDARGVTGPAFTDSRLAPLDRALTRATLGADTSSSRGSPDREGSSPTRRSTTSASCRLRRGWGSTGSSCCPRSPRSNSGARR